MKKTAIFSFLSISLFACTKEVVKQDGKFKVTFSVTGRSVEQFKTSCNSIINNVNTPFSGTKDTTIYVQGGTVLKLETRAGSQEDLDAYIYVNDVFVATMTDTDPDDDGKTEVQIEYTLPVK